jgi:hypothetical protein
VTVPTLRPVERLELRIGRFGTIGYLRLKSMRLCALDSEINNFKNNQVIAEVMLCRVGHLFFFKRSFVFSNLFRVRNRGIRSRYLVYWSKNHKYDFMHKRTSLELGPELRCVLGRC